MSKQIIPLCEFAAGCKRPKAEFATKYCDAHSLLGKIAYSRRIRKWYSEKNDEPFSFDVRYFSRRFAGLDKKGQVLVLAELPKPDAKAIVDGIAHPPASNKRAKAERVLDLKQNGSLHFTKSQIDELKTKLETVGVKVK